MNSAPVQQMARTAGIFQLLVAVPIMAFLGGFIFFSVFDTDVRIYEFIAAIFNALFSAGVVFIVLIQRKVVLSRTLTLYFEIAKSTLASAAWIWLLVDTIFGPNHWHYYPHTPRKPRIIRASVSIILLIFLYYPTLVFAIVDRKWHEERNDDDLGDPEDVGANAGETEPLLRR